MALTICKAYNSPKEENYETILLTAQDLTNTQLQMNLELLDDIPSLHIKLSHMYPCVEMKIDSEIPENSFDSYPDKFSHAVFDRTQAPLQPYRCDKCSYSSKYPSYLKKHLIVHSQSRPYNCETCPGSFKRLIHNSISKSV